MEPTPDRRAFLRRSAGTVAAAGLLGSLGVLEACSSSGSPAAPPGSSGTGTVGPGATATGTVPAVEWSRLASSLQGTLVRPGDAAYPDARVVFNTRYDGVYPAAVAFCASVADVQATLRFARETGIRLVPRTGRHSYAGYSTTDGLVLDLSRIASVTVASDRATATVGAGAMLIDAYSALTDKGAVLSGGSCPTVGISGLVLGGGLGLLSRAHGTTSDNLREVEVVTAAGDIVVANDREHPDLYWACRGGGGGNFGVATRYVFDVQPADMVTTFQLSWAWEAAPKVLDAWQRWLATLPDEVFTIAKITTQDPAVSQGQPGVLVFGQYLGPEGPLRALIAPMLDPELGPPTSTDIRYQSMFSAIQLWAGCVDLTVPQCHEPVDNPSGTLARAGFTAKSDFFTTPLTGPAFSRAIDWVERRQRDATLTGSGTSFAPGALQFDSMGGAINRPAPDASAFVHRDAFSHGQYLAYWPVGAPAETIAANTTWIRAFYEDMRPAASGFSYQNYIDPDLPDWERAYYGANLDRLRRIKRAYDPDDFFRFPQSIRPS